MTTSVLTSVTTVFFVAFSFYIPEESTARIAVSTDQSMLHLRCCQSQRFQVPKLWQEQAI